MEFSFFKIETTKDGSPAIWEEGCGVAKRGHAIIICGEQGEMLQAIAIGHKACKQHALFTFNQKMHIVESFYLRGKMTISIFNIFAPVMRGKEVIDVIAKSINHFKNNKWDSEPTGYFEKACSAAAKKCRSYKCRTAFYAIEPEKKSCKKV